MKITIEGQVFEYDPNRMLNTEAIALQKVTGMKMADWAKALAEGDVFAVTGLVWLMYRREGRDVRFDEVEFDLGTMEIEEDEDEVPKEPVGPTEPVPEVTEETVA